MKLLERIWYSKGGWPVPPLRLLLLSLLLPLSWLFRGVVAIRRRWHWFWRPPALSKRPGWLRVPVAVVGNISVGGTGKTPLLIALAHHLKSINVQPGVISRGYGGKAPAYPLSLDSRGPLPDPAHCGDEPRLIAEKTGCPVVVAPDRQAALKHLLEKFPQVDVVLSDDGLQHHGLWRDMEIIVVDGERMLGNGRCLPAGPLREPAWRLNMSDFVLLNGGDANSPKEKAIADLPDYIAYRMHMKPRYLSNLLTGEKLPISDEGSGKMSFKADSRVQAVAGIGNPARFFRSLESLPCLSHLTHPVARFSFPDHHRFSLADFQRAGIDLQQPVVMTEKDGVKCRDFATANCWVLEAEVEFPGEFLADFHLELMEWENDLEQAAADAAGAAGEKNADEPDETDETDDAR